MSEQRAYFEYHPEGLDEGSRTLTLDGVNITTGRFHHFAVTVYGTDFTLFVDGRQHGSRISLVGALEDGPGILFVGQKLNSQTRYSGMHPTSVCVHVKQVCVCVHVKQACVCACETGVCETGVCVCVCVCMWILSPRTIGLTCD